LTRLDLSGLCPCIARLSRGLSIPGGSTEAGRRSRRYLGSCVRVGRYEDVSGYAAKMSAFASARCQWLRAGFSPGLRPPDRVCGINRDVSGDDDEMSRFGDTNVTDGPGGQMRVRVPSSPPTPRCSGRPHVLVGRTMSCPDWPSCASESKRTSRASGFGIPPGSLIGQPIRLTEVPKVVRRRPSSAGPNRPPSDPRSPWPGLGHHPDPARSPRPQLSEPVAERSRSDRGVCAIKADTAGSHDGRHELRDRLDR
jgi:hypothetical protein